MQLHPKRRFLLSNCMLLAVCVIGIAQCRPISTVPGTPSATSTPLSPALPSSTASSTSSPPSSPTPSSTSSPMPIQLTVTLSPSSPSPMAITEANGQYCDCFKIRCFDYQGVAHQSQLRHRQGCAFEGSAVDAPDQEVGSSLP
jgi:hypothetical protein